MPTRVAYYLFVSALVSFHLSLQANEADIELSHATQPCKKERYNSIVEARINSTSFPEFLEVYANNEHLWLPIEPLIFFAEGRLQHSLEQIQITLYADGETLNINLADGFINTMRQQFRFDPECLFTIDNNTFVSASLLEAYLNLKIKYRSSEGFVDIYSGAPLPRDRRIQREANWQKLDSAGPTSFEQAFPRVAVPYGFVEGLYTDATISLQDDSSHGSNTNFNTFSTAEAFGLTHTLFTSGDEKGLSSARWTASRTSPYGDLFGIPNLYQVSLGDITDLSSPMIGSSGLSRGIKFQAAPVTLTDNFSSTTIEGDAIPGWDAELYIEGVLRAFQKVDENGRFNFNEISISYGTNNLAVVLYGPNGEVEKLDYSQIVSAGMLPPGEVYTWGSLTQSNRSMLLESHTLAENESSVNYSFRSDWGVTHNLTLSGQIVRQTETFSFLSDDITGKYDFAGLEARSKITSINFTAGFKRNLQTEANAFYFNTNLPNLLSGINLNFEFANNEFNSNYTGSGAAALRRNIRFSTNIQLPNRLGSIFTIGQHRQLQNYSATENLDLIYGHSLYKLPVTHNLTFNRRKAANGSWEDPIGNYRAITSYDSGLFLIRSELLASVFPNIKAEQFNLQFDYRRSDHEIYSASFAHNFDQGNSFSLNSSHQYEHFNLSASLTHGARENTIAARLGFSFGFARGEGLTLSSRPYARTSRLKISAFEDLNYNMVRDDNEPYVNGLDIRLNNQFVEPRTTSSGEYFIDNLTANQPINVEVGQEYLSSNFQTSKHLRQQLVPRMGRITEIQVPVVESSILSGKVYFKNNSDKLFPLSMATISAYHSSGIKYSETISISDGYFSLEGLMPGDWMIKVTTRRLSVTLDEVVKTKELTISPGELDIVNFDFIFELPSS